MEVFFPLKKFFSNGSFSKRNPKDFQQFKNANFSDICAQASSHK